MERPTYKEYKKHIKEPGRLIRAGALRSYIETTPYRFKYVQIVLFALVTIAALVTAYMIPSIADKTIPGENLFMECAAFLIPAVYLIFVILIFERENTLRYLFAGFKQVPEDYFQGRESFSKGKKPSYMDIMRNLDLQQWIRRKNIKPHDLIYCPDGRVFKEKRFRIYNTIWSDLIILTRFSWLFVYSFSFMPTIADNGSGYGVFLPFPVVIVIAILFICIFFIFPAVRRRFNKFEEVDIDKTGAEAEETGGGRSYTKGAPYRYKYAQAALFIIMTIALLAAAYVIINDLTGLSGRLSGRYIFLNNVLLCISVVYILFVRSLFFDENLIRYIFSGSGRAPDERFRDRRDDSGKKPSYMDIMLDTIKLKKTEHKDDIRRNFIYRPDGRAFEEKRFSAFYTAWDIIWHLNIFVLIAFIFSYIFLVSNDYMAFYAFTGLSAYSICLYFVFPALRWRLGRFEEVDIEKIQKEELADEY